MLLWALFSPKSVTEGRGGNHLSIRYLLVRHADGRNHALCSEGGKPIDAKRSAEAKNGDELDQDTAAVSIYKTSDGSLCCS